jgi:hypothetical protein
MSQHTIDRIMGRAQEMPDVFLAKSFEINGDKNKLYDRFL